LGFTQRPYRYCEAAVGQHERKALYPGTFDPPTNGHVDLIQRGAKLFEHLTVAILNNPVKNPLFTVEERVEMLKESTASLWQRLGSHLRRPDGRVRPPAGRHSGPARHPRHLRLRIRVPDGLMNRRLAPEIETVFLQPAGRYSFVSSRMLKEVFSFGGDVSGLVPAQRPQAAARAAPATRMR
jgi:pantetheine-phosphate adenylyltransferase